MDTDQTVFVIDDDAALRGALDWLCSSVGLKTKQFENAQAFFDSACPRGDDCIVLDVRLRGMSGIVLQEKLVAENVPTAVIMITGHGDVPMAVKAVRNGAFDFIEKPFDDQILLDRIQQALTQGKVAQQKTENKTKLTSRLSLLTPREREVMNYILSGPPNKTVATQLGISCRTVEVHRRRIMEKMQVRSLAELIRIGFATGVF